MNDTTTPRVDPALLAGNRRPLASYQATHFQWQVSNGVGTITLHRPERKNPLTFSAYAELRDLFNNLRLADDVHAVVVTGAGGNFCSGGDVHEIIGPLIRLTAPELLAFTRMTGDLVKHMRGCPQPVIAAIDGVCAGAGAIIAMASDMRLGTAKAKVAFLFNKVGLAGCDMGACAMLPRIVGQGRASELLFTGRAMTAHEGLVERVGSPTDRRSWIVRLTDPGRSGCQAMAAEHERWVLELFAGLDAKAVQQLHAQLGVLRVHLTRLQQPPVPGDTA